MPRPKQTTKHYPARPCCIAGCPNSTHEGWPATRCRTCNVQFVRDWRKKNKEAHAAHERTEKLRRSGLLPRLNPAERVDWRAKSKDAGHRRRAKLKGCHVSKADLLQVVERSGGVCHGCNSFVPERYRHIDHIVPLDKGGPHSQENLQLLCYRCNTSKGAKLPEEVKPETWRKKPLPGQPFLLNPNWNEAGLEEDWKSDPFRVVGRVTFGKKSWLVVRTAEWPGGVHVPREAFEAGLREWSAADVARWDRDVREREETARRHYLAQEWNRTAQLSIDLDFDL